MSTLKSHVASTPSFASSSPQGVIAERLESGPAAATGPTMGLRQAARADAGFDLKVISVFPQGVKGDPMAAYAKALTRALTPSLPGSVDATEARHQAIALDVASVLGVDVLFEQGAVVFYDPVLTDSFVREHSAKKLSQWVPTPASEPATDTHPMPRLATWVDAIHKQTFRFATSTRDDEDDRIRHDLREFLGLALTAAQASAPSKVPLLKAISAKIDATAAAGSDAKEMNLCADIRALCEQINQTAPAGQV